MTEIEKSFTQIDKIIERVDQYKTEPFFSEEKNKRQNKIVSKIPNDNEILKTLSYLIAFSQNSNSEIVEQALKSGSFDKAFNDFEIDEVVKLNPCDIADNHWSSIKGIRQQAKLFHIVSLARKIKNIGSFAEILYQTNIPKTIKIPPKMHLNFAIQPKGVISKQFLNLGIADFPAACKFVAELAYRRNFNKKDLLCVFKDRAGTCSTKHATLRKLALENSFPEVQLMLGIFKMDKFYAPKIENTLSQHHLEYIPEAHNYLKINSEYFDFTTPHSKYSDFKRNLLKEYEIEFDQIHEYKIEIHKNYLKSWIKNHQSLNEELAWIIREKCISDLQK